MDRRGPAHRSGGKHPEQRLAAARPLGRTGPDVRPGGRGARLARGDPTRRFAAGRGPGRTLGRRATRSGRGPAARAGLPRRRPAGDRDPHLAHGQALRHQGRAARRDRVRLQGRTLQRRYGPASAPALLAPPPAARPAGVRRAPPGRRGHRQGAPDGCPVGAGRREGRRAGRGGGGDGRPGRGGRPGPETPARDRPRGAARRRRRGGEVRRRAAAGPGRGADPARLRDRRGRAAGATAQDGRQAAGGGGERCRPDRPGLAPHLLGRRAPPPQPAAPAGPVDAGPGRAGSPGPDPPRTGQTGVAEEDRRPGSARTARDTGPAGRFDAHRGGAPAAAGRVPRRVRRADTHGAGPRPLAPCAAATGPEPVRGARRRAGQHRRDGAGPRRRRVPALSPPRVRLPA